MTPIALTVHDKICVLGAALRIIKTRIQLRNVLYSREDVRPLRRCIKWSEQFANADSNVNRNT